MNKKFFMIPMLIVLFVACTVFIVADAHAVENAENARYVLTTAAIADAGTGDCMDVDTSGHAQVDIAASSVTLTSALSAGTAEIGKVKISDGTEQASVDTENNLEVAEDSKLAEDCTEAELVLTGAGRFYGFSAIGPTAGDDVTIYDNTAGSGTKIAYDQVDVTNGRCGYFIPGGVLVTNGIFVTGTDSDVDTIVYYKDY